MKPILVAILLGTLLVGCGTTQPTKSRPGAILEGADLPSVDPGVMAATNRPPVPVRMQNPLYPLELRKRKIEGEVIVEFIVNASGRVVDAHAIQWTHPDMAQAAVDAMLKSEFRPAMKDGKPTAVRMQAPIVFNLKNTAPNQAQAPRQP